VLDPNKTMPEISPPVATLLAALVGGLLLLYVHRLNAKRTASAKFRAALLQAFSGLYPIPSNWPENIDAHLRGIFPVLQAAVAEFRPFVFWFHRRSYDAAWLKYHCSTGRSVDAKSQVYHDYYGFTSPEKPVSDAKDVFHANVSRLLQFASGV
jgi:hypothetical protein